MNQQMPKDAHPYAPTDDAPKGNATGQQQAGAAAPPQAEIPTIAQAKKWCCERLTAIFTSPLMNERLMKMAGGDASRVAKNLTAFLTLITQHDGGSVNNRKYYHQCSIQSLVTCFLESMNMQLPFDSRNLVSIVIYDWEAELDISYKGFVNALNRHYRDAFVDTKIIMESDEFTCEEEPEKVTYKHKAKNPFAVVNAKMDGVQGCYCYFAYTLTDGRRVQRIMLVPKADLLLMRSKAKSKNVWDEWTSQQIIKSTIRRAAKIPFAAIDLDVDIEEVANRHYLLEQSGGNDRLKQLMAAQEEVVSGKPAEEPTANTDGGDAKPAAKDDGQKPETAAASVDKPAGDAAATAVPADDDKPQPDKPATELVARSGDTHSGSDGQSLAENKADDKKPLLVTEEPKHQEISDAEFEEVKS